MQHRCGFLITQIKTISSRLLDKVLEQHGVEAFNGAQGRILDVLWQRDGIPIRDVSRETGLSMSALTGMLDRMEASGLIQRRPDPGDRRKLQIVLTEKTRAMETEYQSISKDMDDLFLNGFSEAETVELQSYLERILRNLQNAEQRFS